MGIISYAAEQLLAVAVDDHLIAILLTLIMVTITIALVAPLRTKLIR